MVLFRMIIVLIIYVDMDDKGNGSLKRTPKKSYAWMKEIIASNGAKLSEI